jgi:hypothetical protein
MLAFASIQTPERGMPKELADWDAGRPASQSTGQGGLLRLLSRSFNMQ